MGDAHQEDFEDHQSQLPCISTIFIHFSREVFLKLGGHHAVYSDDFFNGVKDEVGEHDALSEALKILPPLA